MIMKSRCLAISRAVKHGFTLIEILVATAIMALLVLVVLGITTNVLTSWTRASGQLSSNLEARVALDFLAQDLEAAIIRRDGNQWMFIANQAGTGNFTNFTNAVGLYFFSPVPDRPRRDSNDNIIHGDVCGISYRLFRQNPFNPASTTTSQTYGLYRAVVPADATFFAMLGPGNQDDLVTLWQSSINYTRGGVAMPPVDLLEYQRSTENFLSANVADFAITIWYIDPDTNEPTPVNGTVTNPLPLQPGDEVFIGRNMRLGETGDPLPYPIYFDVSITILSNDGASLLRQEETAGSVAPDRFREIVREHGNTYSRRIQLLSRPL